MNITRVEHLLVNKEASVPEILQAHLDMIAEKNPDINAYLEVYDDAIEQAKHVQHRIEDGEELPLAGVPISLKDNILYKGHTASAASKMLQGYTAAYTATTAKALIDAGAVILGRVNMDEFAMGGSTENSALGATKNPLDPTRIPGGSSGGSAASVAMGGAVASLGSDTGGSVRFPAAMCGLVGMKSTYGRVSRYGVIAMGSSLDQVAPLTRSVLDMRKMFRVIDTYDSKDNNAIPLAQRISQARPGGTRIGVIKGAVDRDGVSPQIKASFDATLNTLSQNGYEIVEIEIPHLHYAVPAYYVTMFAEASTNLARFDGIRYGTREAADTLYNTYTASRAHFGPEVRRRILLGNYVLSEGYADQYYYKASGVRALLQQEYQAAFESVDYIVTPTSPVLPPKIGQTTDPVSMYLMDVYTVMANLTGHPAMSVPAGIDEATGLPIGFHITAPYHAEERMFDLAQAVQDLG